MPIISMFYGIIVWLRLVQAWIELRKDELLADWDLAVAGEMPYRIDPL